MKTLRLAPDLVLPLSAVTSTFGLLAVRGAGKSNTAAVMAEEMFDAGLPFVVVDPVGSWFGLRSGADGAKAGGLPIPIFGGKHGDLPLERGAGELLADLIAEKRLSCVLDLSNFASEGDKKAFLLAFARRLYQKNADPLHLFLEEADDYIPQRPMRDEAQLLRAWENIVRRGRARGLGITLITQRSAAVAKMVLTQVETLFAMRTTGPQDIAAVEAWVKYHQVDGEVVRSLASLAPGEAWVWSPQFLGTTKRVQIRRRRTFDSGATPKNVTASAARKPATLADVDLEALQGRMAATIEKAKAEDPRELRRQLAEARAELARAQEVAAGTVKSSAEYSKSIPGGVKAREIEVLTDADRERLEQFTKALRETMQAFLSAEHEAYHSIVPRVRDMLEDGIRSAAAKADQRTVAVVKRLEAAGFQRVLEKLDRATVAPAPATAAILRSQPRPVPPARGSSAGLVPIQRAQPSAVAAGVNGAQQAILDALAYFVSVGIDAPTRQQAALVAKVSASSSGYEKNLGLLRTHGLVDYPAGGLVTLTEAGRRVATIPPPPTSADLHDAIYARLSGPQGALLRVLIGAGGRPVTRETLADAANVSATSSGFEKNVGILRALGLAEFPQRGQVAAASFLFLDDDAAPRRARA